jgi:hypothetical protein
MTELKRCPFCGKEPQLLEGAKMVFCANPLCGMNTMEVFLWNTRPIEDELNARIKELESEIDKWQHYDPSENMEFIREQALNSGSLAAQGIYIRVLEAENNKFKTRIKELEHVMGLDLEGWEIK